MTRADNHNKLFSRTRPIDVAKSGRTIWLLTLAVLGFVFWANWAVLDEQVRARGKVIVSSRSQLVQAVDGGVLAALHVREGQQVQAGDLLAELDQTRFAASAAETRAKTADLRANAERLQAELAGQALRFSQDIASDANLVRRQTNLHQRRLQQQKEESESILKSLKLAKQELKALQTLAATGDAAQSELLKAQRQVIDLRSELINKKNIYRRDAQEQLSNTQAELEQALQILKQRDEALKATKITAPMTGAVKRIEINTIGAVLKAGDELMQIVPSDEPMLVEARIYSSDVAFVRPALPANVKLDAYDFTVFGSFKGKVTYISPDTIDVDLRQNEDPYYRALIEITQLPTQQRAADIDIIPGMTAEVEIITGNKTVAQYLLKPLRRGSAQALTER